MEEVCRYVVVGAPDILIGGIVVHLEVFLVLFSAQLDTVEHSWVIKLHFPFARRFFWFG